MPEDDEILATLEVSAPRSWLGIAVTVLLGFLMFVIALTQPPQELHLLAVLIIVGIAALWSAWSMYKASTDAVILTRSALTSRSGTELCRIADIMSVDRGALAFKPSGGFLLGLRSRQSAAWVPGLWWRLGRRIGVGGVTRSAEARAMAELIDSLRSSDQVR